VPSALLAQGAQRPAFAALTSERGLVMPTLAHALVRYLEEGIVPAHTTHANLDAAVLT